VARGVARPGLGNGGGEAAAPFGSGEGRAEAGDAFAGDAAGAGVFGEAFDFFELLLRDEAAGDAFLGFVDEAFAVFVAGCVGEPGRMVTLVARPLDVAAVDFGVDLIFSLDGILVPPTERDTHRGSVGEAGCAASENSATAAPG